MSNSKMETLNQKQAMIDALEANYGNITLAAKAAEISIRTHYRWLKEDQDYGDQYMSIKDIGYEKVRNALLNAALKRIEKGEATILNQMLRLFYNNLQEDMKRAAFVNKVAIIKPVVKFISRIEDSIDTDPARRDE